MNVERPIKRSFHLGFHLRLALAVAVIILFIIWGCYDTHIVVRDLAGSLIAFVVVMAGIQALPVYWHSKGKADKSNAAWTIPWFGAFLIILPYMQDIAARLGRNRILQDENFMRIDQALGVSVPSMIQWASHHTIGTVAYYSYFLLVPYMFFAFLLPALTGRVKAAQQFIAANFFAMFISTPLFGLYPAVGPWYGYHFAGGIGEVQCQNDLLALRETAVYLHHRVGVVSFPSGHTLEAILCCYALWNVRFLRIPAIVLSSLIIYSTMTTGWHYFFDVLGGAFVAVLSIYIARWFDRWDERARAARLSAEHAA
jgi:membrane-associated phospholipid phosphatase